MDQRNVLSSAQAVGPGVWELVLAGEMNAAAESSVNDALARGLQSGPKTIILDFRGLQGIDGTGLGLLVRLCVRMSREKRELLGFGLSPRCRVLFDELGFPSVISLHGSREKALRAAGVARAGEPDRGGETGAEACPAACWAGPLGRAHVGGGPEGLNVDGHRVRGPFEGFGELWDKTYTVRLSGAAVKPTEVIALCGEKLGEFWPPGSSLQFSPDRLAPGAVGLIEVRLPGGMPLKTGMRVLHVGPDTFTFVTLSGHMEAGFITFGAREEDGATVVRVESIARTGDPLYEAGFVLFGHSQQEAFWRSTLEALAGHYGVVAEVQVSKSLLDGTRQWAGAKNVVFNAAARTGLFAGLSLLSRALRPARR